MKTVRFPALYVDYGMNLMLMSHINVDFLPCP